MPYPLYAPDQLLPALRDYLIAQGLVRKPAIAGTAHPMWLDPKRGIPYPGQKEGLEKGVEPDSELVLAAYPATGIPSQPFEGFLVKLGATIWYAGSTSPIVQTMHEKIRGVLHDRRNIDMNGLLVNQAQMVREIQRISAGPQGYVYNCQYMFDLWNPNYEFT